MNTQSNYEGNSEFQFHKPLPAEPPKKEEKNALKKGLVIINVILKYILYKYKLFNQNSNFNFFTQSTR